MVQNINSSQLNRRLFPLTSATHPFYGSLIKLVLVEYYASRKKVTDMVKRSQIGVF